jgi:hypothetical protein
LYWIIFELVHPLSFIEWNPLIFSNIFFCG